ncbi:MAG: type II toxin-antitoxin system Phd/YefM family antitoxin [Candidatus Competibacteraceae bacterium]|nr:type II toxin-antitoxin system Phd/YefM family antitoxin [Candidatus Competibacteraceae bacterium]
MILTVPITDAAVSELIALAKTQGKTTEQIVAELVERYLEDAEDLADALDALHDGETTIPLERVKAELGF